MFRCLRCRLAQLPRRCARVPVVLFLAVTNLTLLALILGEYTSPGPSLVPVGALSNPADEPSNNNLSAPLFLLPVHNGSGTAPLPPKVPARFRLYPLNAKDPTTNRTVIAETFSPSAYYNVNVASLDVAAQKALETNAAMCDGITSEWAWKQANKTGMKLCSCKPDTLEGRLRLDLAPPTLEEMATELSSVEAGGHWSPADCVPRQRLAIIVPYKDRAVHLRVFLYHYHRILQKQQIEYRFFVAEQAHPDIFNKGSIMNTGFTIASKFYDFDCVIFHDIDLLLEDDRHLYLCTDQPRHLTVRNDRANYTMPYKSLVGGGLSMWAKTFREVNGYSNTFYGWGGEDDNLAERIKSRDHQIFRYQASISRYSMMKHERKGGSFPYNTMVFRQLKDNRHYFKTEGLNSLKYILHDQKNLTLYTWIYAEWDSDVSHYTDKPGWCSKGHYRQGKRVTINKCASKCLGETKCAAFSYVFGKTPSCYLYAQTCDVEEHKELKTHMFIKKRT